MVKPQMDTDKHRSGEENIGGVACGPKAASRIKRLNPDAEVTIIEKGEILSYAGCGLPYYISGEIHDHSELMTSPAGVVRDTHFFKNVKDIRVLNKTVAESVDRESKVVRFRYGLPAGSTANKHGRVIADNICGIPTTFKGIPGTVIVKLFNLSFAKSGLTQKAAE